MPTAASAQTHCSGEMQQAPATQAIQGFTGRGMQDMELQASARWGQITSHAILSFWEEAGRAIPWTG